MRKKRNTFAAFLLGAALLIGVVPAMAAEKTEQTAVSADKVSASILLSPVRVIEQQLKALHDRDALAAFALMTPSRQQDFKNNPKIFLTTVRMEQHALYNHNSFKILGVTQNEAQAIPRVMLEDKDGNTSLAIFRLVRQPDGQWRIQSVGLTGDEGDKSI